MAKSLDQLIDFLLEEIALGGEEGKSVLLVVSKWAVGQFAEHGPVAQLYRPTPRSGAQFKSRTEHVRKSS